MLKPAALLFFLALPTFAAAQTSPDTIEKFIADSEMIFIGKVVDAGPVNIIAQSNVELTVLLMIKGDASLNKYSYSSRRRMEKGKAYLVRFAKVGKDGDERETVIEVHESYNIERLRELSPRIVVLRTINIQLETLDSIIRTASDEEDQLKSLKGDN